MKKNVFAAIFLFTQIVFAQDLFTQVVPIIYSPKPHHDFGEILEGQVVSHSFEIKNTGNADLKIEKVRASCGCTAVEPEKNILKPGESTKVKAEFDSRGRFGPQNKSVYVFTNDKKNPQFKLSFSAVIVDKLSNVDDAKAPKLVIEKNNFNFGKVEEGKIVDAKIGFVNSGKGVLEIIDVKTTCGCTAALLSSRKLNPGERGTLRIELDTSNREGNLTRTITLFSNDPAQNNQSITISANIEKRK
jgi:hypothetical protein